MAHSDKAVGDGHKTEIQEIPLRYKRNMSAVKSGQRLAQVAQSGFGVSVLRDIQNPTGYGLLKANPTLNRGDGLDDLRIPSRLSNLDSVIVFPNIATQLARLS